MSEGERPLLEEVLDYTVYAPIGLALTVLEDLPALVAKGRGRISTQVTVARFVGKMAARQARRRVDDLLATDGPVTSSPTQEIREQTIETVARVTPVEGDTSTSEAADHAIPGYDTLAASQVVARLVGLDAADLEAVRLHEASHRARRTILTRIDQLREARSND